MLWNFKKRRGAARRPQRKLATPRLVLEELESRIQPSTSVPTYHYDTSSTGQDLTETVLNPGNVNSSTFGKLVSTGVDGQVYAQPLYMPNLAITAPARPGTHNVVFIATEHDGLYAIDANTGSILWQDSFINPANGVTTVSSRDVNTNDIFPEIGITGTPVIDPATNTLYVDVLTKEISGGATHFVTRLHAIDITNGADKDGGPVTIADTIYDGANYTYVSGPSVKGTGDGNINGVITFNALRQLQRPALSLVNGTIYIAYASNADNGPYHGWVLGYDAQTLQLKAVFNDSPNGGLGGIWMSGGRISSDRNGNLYLSTGNGTFDTTFDANGFPSLGDYGDSVVKLAVDPTSTAANPNINGWGLKVVDYFTPFDQQALASQDYDLGSGGLLLLPDSAGSAAHPHLMTAAGKEGRLYLIDRDNMGKYDPNTDHIVQEVVGGIQGSFNTPAYYNGSIYYVCGYFVDVAKSFSISNGLLSTSPTSRSAASFAFPGSTPSISAEGTSNGVVWAIDKGTNELRAYDASSFGTLLYTSNQAPNNRDLLGAAVKFNPPVVTDGEVFVGTANSVAIYGLLKPPTAPPNAPSNLAATALSSTQINLAWTDNSNNEDGCQIQQSTDGVNYQTIATVPLNTTSFTVSGLQAATTYSFRVLAFNSIGSSAYSNTVSATTDSGPAPVGVDFSNGFATAGTALTLTGGATIQGSLLQLTDGGASESRDVFSSNQVNISNFSTTFAFQQLSAQANGFMFCIQSFSQSAAGGVGGGMGYLGIPSSIAVKFDVYTFVGKGNNSTGLYLDGAQPGVTTGSIDLTGTGINLRSGDLMQATFNYDGTNLVEIIKDTVTGATATETYAVNIPSVIGSTAGYVGFTAGTGSISATQNILSWKFTPGPVAPSGLTATPLSATSVSLSWVDNGTTATGYDIEQSSDGVNFVPVGTASANAAAYVVGNLQPATAYAFRVRAFNVVGNSDYTNAANATTLAGVGPGFVDFSGGFANSTGLVVLNGASAKISGSSLQLTDGGANEAASAFLDNPVNVAAFASVFTFQLTNPNADGFTFCIQGLAPTAIGLSGGGLGYRGLGLSAAIKFDLYNNAGEGNDSTGLYLDGAPPYAVGSADLSNTGINLHSGDVMQVTLTYDGTNLNVSIKDTLTGASATQTYAVNIPAAVGGTTAYVGFTGGTGASTATEQILSWTYTPAPPAPVALAAATTPNTEIDLAWAENATNQTGFKIERSADGVSFFQIAIVGNVNTYADTTIATGTQYYYRIRATNAGGDSPYSNLATAEPPVSPATPSHAHATLITTHEIDLAWTDNSNNEDGFYVLRKTGTAGDLVLIATLPPNTTSYNDKGLTPGTEYDYHIEAFNAAGNNDFAGAALMTVPLPPAQVSATGGFEQATVTWSAAPGAATYNVYRTITGTTPTLIPVITGLKTTSYTDPALDDDATYIYEVTAVNPGGESNRSQGASATTTLSLSAAYSGTPPLYWQPGQTLTYTVTVTNTGLATWHALGSNLFDLGVYFNGTDDGAGDWPSEPARAYLTADVGPGQSETITVTVTAPTTPGTYILRQRMVDENVAWFNDLQGASVLVAMNPDPPAFAATYNSQPPAVWQPGQTQTYSLTVTNTGTQTWSHTGSNAVDLGIYFDGTGDGSGQWSSEPTRAYLASDVAPGQSATISVTTTAPATAGSYVLRQRLVQENIAWFGMLEATAVTVGGTPMTPALSATYSGSPPLYWQPGQTKTYTLTVTNTGSQTWYHQGPNAVDLGIYFNGTGDSAGQWPSEPMRAFLSADVAPGASETITITATAPSAPGTYALRQRLVEENVVWFNDLQKTSVSVNGTPPTVTGVTPVNGAVSIALTAPVTVTFSEPIDPTTLTPTNFNLVVQGTTSLIAASITYDATTQKATLQPSSPLQAGTTYVATLKGGPGGIADLEGNLLLADDVWSFST
jgi:fibronectin type 3 domain-containing protein